MNHWIEIDDAALAANFQAIGRVAGAEVLAVVKANAYGHGAEHCAVVLAGAGARWLGVTCAEEGVRVRRALESAGHNAAGHSAEILVMSGTLAEDVPLLAAHSLVPVVWTLDQVRTLPLGTRVHVEVDTGMGRQGVVPGAALGELLAGMAQAGLVLDGLFTHFCSSEVAGSALTRTQQSRFERAVAQVRAAGLIPAWLHAANTSAIDNPAGATWLPRLAESLGARPMVRSGLALYGLCLPIEGDAAPHLRPALRPVLRPVLRWHARLLAVRELAAGDTVGYNATFTALGPMRVGLVPVGYADGLRRELGSNAAAGWMMLGGTRCPILGRVSMNLTVIDLTACPHAAAGDTVTVLGPGITAEDHARLVRTIPYEILCGLRAPRR